MDFSLIQGKKAVYVNRKTAFSVILIIFLALSACTREQYDAEKDFEVYISESDKTAAITGYIGNKAEVRIPPRIGSLPVTEINDSAFRAKRLKSVTIPDGVTTIGIGAFYNNQLTSVTIPNSVTYIGYEAFAYNQLTSLVIPNSVTSIGNGAFQKNQLTDVVIPEGVTYIGKSAFAFNRLTSVVIPEGVTSIGEMAFYNNQLTNITIPNSVTSIGNYAFQDNQLTSIIIPDSVTLIGDNAFIGNRLTSITIGANVVMGPRNSNSGINSFFDRYYERRGKIAGTYTNADGIWRLVIEGEEFEDDSFEEQENIDWSIRDTVVVRFNVEASSELLNYPAQNLHDQKWLPWAEGAPGNGVGEYFTISNFRLAIAGFALKNGHGNLDYYGKNNRVKSFKIYIDDVYTETISIKDSISFEQYVFKELAVCRTIRFEIDDVYPGTNNGDTYIAEIALLRNKINDRVFYDNILFWVSQYFNTPYESNVGGIASISDIDKTLLRDYLPFDSLVEKLRMERSKIAFLENPSTLSLRDNLPRIDGATAMYPLYSSFVHAVYPEVDIAYPALGPVGNRSERVLSLFKWPYTPNRNFIDEIFHSASYFPNVVLESIVQCNTTSEAYRRLINGETDIVFCYEPSQAERNAAAEKGLRFNLTPIAKDAFVFIVNEKNVLNNITQRQIRDIYSGRVTNWRDISGADEPVIAYQRPQNSGSQTILQSIMREDRLIHPIIDSEFVPGGMGGMINKVTSNFYNYNSAIGYTFLFYLTQMADSTGVKTLSVDGVAPTHQNIQNNRYPFAQTVYAVTTGNESENTRRFIEWILGEQGQELVAKTGYIQVR
jgi:phosphate transport system substrate-binding protein